MWHLPKPSDDTLNWYKERFLEPIADAIRGPEVDDVYRCVLLQDDSPDTIEKLLVSPPEQLYPFCQELEDRIDEQGGAHDSECLLKAFGYDRRISQNKSNSYKLAEKIGTRTCVYCNSVYTFTIVDVDGKSISRPDFDHWLPKEKHPLLSMSFYNLMPSCPYCNRGIKLRNEFQYGIHVHPYDSPEEMEARFQYKPLPGGRWSLILTNASSMEQATASILKTEDVYKPYANCEVKDILDFAYDNPPEYLMEIKERIMKAFGGTISKEKAYRIAFGTSLEASLFLDRPLSKMKRDVLLQLQKALGITIIDV